MLGVLILIVLASGCITGNMNNVNVVNNTYSGEGVSSKIPANWKVSKLTDETNTNIKIDKNNSTDGTLITIAKLPNPKGMSDQDGINAIQNPTNQGGNYQKISNNTTTVDGNTAYETTYIVNDTSRFTQIMKEQQINFIKNGTTYALIFDAPENTFDKEKSNFDITLNSFRILYK